MDKSTYNVVLFHAHDDNPDSHWYSWLKEKLESIGIETIIPSFPLGDNQTPEEWLKTVESLKDNIHRNTILVGHSLGAAMILYTLSNLNLNVSEVVFLGGFGKAFGDSPVDKVCNKFIENLSWKNIQLRTRSIKIFASTNDPAIPVEVSIQLGVNLKSPISFIENAGHFCLKDGFNEIPFLFEYIKNQTFLSIDEFKKLEARIGEVISAEEVEGSEKLIKLMLDFGLKRPVGRSPEHSQEENVLGEERDIRQILSGIKAWYKPELLVGKKMLFVVNLAPREMMGLESQGMLMAVDGVDGAPVFIVPEKEVQNGSRVR